MSLSELSELKNMRKIGWDAVTAIVVVAALLIYASQSLLMYHTLKRAEGNLALMSSSIVNAAQLRLTNNMKAHTYYFDLAKPTSLSRRLEYPEIYGYLNILEALSLLLLRGQLPKEVFLEMYKSEISLASQVLAKASDGEGYVNITRLAKKLDKQNDEQVVTSSKEEKKYCPCIYPCLVRSIP